jgi:hypothetical protein
LHNVIINDSKFDAGEFVEFDREAGSIEINNISGEAIDILLFGGEESVEPIVAQGPFVRNTPQEISQAYHDFHAGKYGEIKYNKASTEQNSRCIKSGTFARHMSSHTKPPYKQACLVLTLLWTHPTLLDTYYGDTSERSRMYKRGLGKIRTSRPVGVEVSMFSLMLFKAILSFSG